FKVMLDVDGDTVTRTFEVRGDPALQLTLAQQKEREAFLVEVQDIQVKVEERSAEIRTRRVAATGAEADRLAVLERRLTAGRDAPRAKLSGVARNFNGSGAQQGSFFPPTALHRQALVDAKEELAAVEKELKGGVGAAKP
ncbi:MAG: hypothetical protein ACHQQR_02440, partial [Gemmatimonadales bacterium]